MPPRPYWKGYLKLSLVSCPVAIYPASSSGERVAFRQINKQTGNRLRQQLVDDVTREPVETSDKGRGYEVDKNVFVMIEDDEIEAVQIESSQTIEIDSFVPRDQIDQRYRESPYYIAPNDQVGQEAFAVIREAMRGKGMVALGRVVLSKRERVIMLEAMGDGLLGTTLRYAYEVRDAEAYFDDIAAIKVNAEMLKLAEHILESKRAEFDPTVFVDRYEDALVEMLKKKQGGGAIARPSFAAPKGNVVDLMEALKRSLKGEPATKAPVSKKRGAKPEDLRKAPQFKFPITGGKAAAKVKPETEAKPAATPKQTGKRKSA